MGIRQRIEKLEEAAGADESPVCAVCADEWRVAVAEAYGVPASEVEPLRHSPAVCAEIRGRIETIYGGA
jgi:hypothetical protein